MLKRAILVFVLVAVFLVAFVGLASASLVWGGGNSAPQSVIWGGGAPVPHGLIWGGGRRDDPPPTSIQRPTVRPTFIFWQPSRETPPVDRYDWSRWFNWLGGIDSFPSK